MAQVDGADGRPVLLISVHKARVCLFPLKSEPPRQVPQLRRVIRQNMCLTVVHHLQVMLDLPEQDVAIGQDAVLVGGEEMAVGKAQQAIQRVAAADFGVRAAMYQLQVLRDELDVADGAFPQLDLAPFPALLAQLRLGALLHRAYDAAQCARVEVVQGALDSLQKRFPHAPISGDHPRFEQGLLFPEARMSFQVGDIAVRRGDQRACLSPGAKPHIHTVEESL